MRGGAPSLAIDVPTPTALGNDRTDMIGGRIVVETGLVVDGDAAFAARVSVVLVDIAFEHAEGLAEARELLTKCWAGIPKKQI